MGSADRWRVVDTGLRAPAQNAALDRALLEAREADEIPSTLRFFRYTPAVLLGAMQDGDPLVDEEARRARGLSLDRRLTDGGTFLCDGSHLAWTIYLGKGDVRRGDGGRAVLKRLCHAAAAAVSALGVEAAYRARNEIAVEGRTLAQAGMLYSENALMFQAVLALDGHIAQRASIMKLPWATEKRAAILRERYTTLREELGRTADIHALRNNLIEAYESEFGVELKDADLTLSEHARYEVADREHRAGAPQHLMPNAGVRIATAVQERTGVALSACVVFDAARVVRQVWFTGCALRPASALPDLEAALRDLPVERVEAKVRSFFSSRPVRCEGCMADDFSMVVKRAVDRPLLAR